MALRRIVAMRNPILRMEVVIFKDQQWQEYRNKFYSRGEYLGPADYYTDNLTDALLTALDFFGIEVVRNAGAIKDIVPTDILLSAANDEHALA